VGVAAKFLKNMDKIATRNGWWFAFSSLSFLEDPSGK
jgi:hypothetical protein